MILKIMIAIAVLFMVVLLLGNKPKIVAYGYDSCSTLWELAEKHCPETVDKWDFIDEVMELNGMEDHTVLADRKYQYPIYKGHEEG